MLTNHSPTAHRRVVQGLSGRISAVVDGHVLSRLLASPRGRAFMLGFMADAEESDEAGVFDNLLSRIDDPELGKLVRRHRDDETRHAELFHACVRRTGSAPPPLPPELRYIDRLDRHLDGFTASFVAGRAGVMEAYLMLQVIEERGVERFAQIGRALAPFDPESASVIEGVVRDEQRHVRYARAISKRYAPDEETLARTLARCRAAESRAFDEHGWALLRHFLAEDLLEVGSVERAFLRGLSVLGHLPSRHTTVTPHSPS